MKLMATVKTVCASRKPLRRLRICRELGNVRSKLVAWTMPLRELFHVKQFALTAHIDNVNSYGLTPRYLRTPNKWRCSTDRSKSVNDQVRINCLADLTVEVIRQICRSSHNLSIHHIGES